MNKRFRIKAAEGTRNHTCFYDVIDTHRNETVISLNGPSSYFVACYLCNELEKNPTAIRETGFDTDLLIRGKKMMINEFYENFTDFKPSAAKDKVLAILLELTKLVREDVVDPKDVMAYIGDGLVHMENYDFFGTEGMNI